MQTVSMALSPMKIQLLVLRLLTSMELKIKGQYFGTMTKPSKVENQDKYLFLPHVINGYTIKQEPYNGDKRSVLQLGDNYGSQFIHNYGKRSYRPSACVKN